VGHTKYKIINYINFDEKWFSFINVFIKNKRKDMFILRIPFKIRIYLNDEKNIKINERI